MKRIIAASTSTLHGGSYLEYILPEIKHFFNGIDEVLFIPFARPSGITHNQYTNKVKEVFKTIGIRIVGLHSFEDKQEVLKNTKGIFIGGGNTFLLVHQLYKYDLIDTIKEVVNNGTAYFGTSAGSNICGPTMMTTNDMPIIYPPSFNTLGFFPFNFNPHYLDPDPNSTHNGETRETRINEYHTYNNTPVLGLREGSWVEVKGDKMMLKGKLTARWFEANKKPIEIKSPSVLNVTK